MEIRVLRYFLETAREGNMTRAAERLFVSQPTMSKQLKELEKELGTKLFVRSNQRQWGFLQTSSAIYRKAIQRSAAIYTAAICRMYVKSSTKACLTLPL